jgi:hypothetical protein
MITTKMFALSTFATGIAFTDDKFWQGGKIGTRDAKVSQQTLAENGRQNAMREAFGRGE